jgi:hypothetical protein
LRPKVKVLRRSLRYVTHHLMVMHPHTKYNWPIWTDKTLWSGQASLNVFGASGERYRLLRASGFGRCHAPSTQKKPNFKLSPGEKQFVKSGHLLACCKAKFSDLKHYPHFYLWHSEICLHVHVSATISSTWLHLPKPEALKSLYRSPEAPKTFLLSSVSRLSFNCPRCLLKHFPHRVRC